MSRRTPSIGEALQKCDEVLLLAFTEREAVENLALVRVGSAPK